MKGGEFPGGTCTVGCDHDEDCPAGTACVEKAGGICLLECEHNPDCRGGYGCKDVDRRGHPGEHAVCIH